ncbi:hypothetical protein LWI28_004932 [Acer negundo]|uniref:Uncharacterized protein n=1 Tax=Acer negundo TaxID=4023 RepID=A0AAD5ID36_ACENE|nr:hypothetical protein LWI28_004932 [Acer negundo]
MLCEYLSFSRTRWERKRRTLYPRNISGEQPDHESFVIPNNSDFPPTYEEIPGTTNHLGHEAKTINTRCTPSQWYQIVKKLSEEQKQVVHALGFGNLLALDCGRLRLRFVDGDQISISGDVLNLDFWKSKFPITSPDIFLKDIEHSFEEMTTTDDEFKVTLCLFLLDTIFSLSANDYVQMGYLIPLRDVGTISLKNGSSWCFSSLCEGIEKFQKNRPIMKTCCISGLRSAYSGCTPNEVMEVTRFQLRNSSSDQHNQMVNTMVLHMEKPVRPIKDLLQAIMPT